MKKIYKVLTTATVLAMAALPIAANAQDVPPASAHTGQGNIMNQVKKSVPGTMGYITDFVNDKTGIWITVTGRGLAATDQQEIRLSVSKDTKIIDAQGNQVQLQTIVDKNKAIKAFYSPNITKSLPAQGSALTIIVQDHDFAVIDGTISEVNKQGILVEGTNLYNNSQETILLHLDPKAKIINQNGNTMKASDLKTGMSIRSFYGPAVALSMPPQSTTNYIRVNADAENNDQEQVAGIDGILTEMKDGRISVSGKPVKAGDLEYIVLAVDGDTKIVDAEGKPLTAEALKSGLRIEAEYVSVIYPALPHADKIVVSDTSAPKVEGTITASERTSKDQLYINVGSDQSTDNDIIINISKDTQVIGLNPDEKLEPGMKIVVFHSPIMTMSIPAFTSAEVIMVQADN
ncbi:peptidase [Paenibacillus sp. ISL-20]|uniref:peptidase n=1 Tax=Paenibacillus sp. ISL-20 TaxID=2819163 RepID=UPI001BE90145|nr:peptidase [Paenibacillus sp. ISL-20]MBT2764706.1 peptidase [Paenibacillus sp. ISL-20]